MKRALAMVLCILILSGCSGETKEMGQALSFRKALLEAEKCSFAAEITTDYGDSLYTFGLSCQADHQGNMVFTVQTPETISGISGKIAAGKAWLTFDDKALEFSPLVDGQVTPVGAPWLLLHALRSGYIASAGYEDELLRLTIEDSFRDSPLHVDVWLEKGNTPCRGEILYKGVRILSLAVVNYQMQ